MAFHNERREGSGWNNYLKTIYKWSYSRIGTLLAEVLTAQGRSGFDWDHGTKDAIQKTPATDGPWDDNCKQGRMKMRKLSVSCIFLMAGAIAIGLWALAPGSAEALSLEFGKVYDGAQPESDGPWLTATFEDVDIEGERSVKLTLEATDLNDYEFVSKWFFNFNPDLDASDLVFDRFYRQDADPEEDPIVKRIRTKTDKLNAAGGGLYDIGIEFSTSEADRFGVGDSAVFLISGIDGLTVTADDFNFMSKPPGGNGLFLAAAHIQGIGDDGKDSGWVAVPEPGTMLLLGCGLVGVALLRRKLRTR